MGKSILKEVDEIERINRIDAIDGIDKIEVLEGKCGAIARNFSAIAPCMSVGQPDAGLGGAD